MRRTESNNLIKCNLDLKNYSQTQNVTSVLAKKDSNDSLKKVEANDIARNNHISGLIIIKYFK